jgi:hypothetical protein
VQSEVREAHSESLPPSQAQNSLTKVIIVRWSEPDRLQLEHSIYILWNYFILLTEIKNSPNSLILISSLKHKRKLTSSINMNLSMGKSKCKSGGCSKNSVIQYS